MTPEQQAILNKISDAKNEELKESYLIDEYDTMLGFEYGFNAAVEHFAPLVNACEEMLKLQLTVKPMEAYKLLTPHIGDALEKIFKGENK